MRRLVRLLVVAAVAYGVFTRWDDISEWVRGAPQTVRAQVQFHGRACDPSYPNVCIPPPPPVLDCTSIRHRNFKVFGSDPHGLDPDKNGLACEP
jgi:hypothetical protein